MPRIKVNWKEYKLKDIKGEISKYMKLKGKTQKDVGDALGVSQPMVSRMLKTSGKNMIPDPFSYGDLLTLCELFELSKEEIERMFNFSGLEAHYGRKKEDR